MPLVYKCGGCNTVLLTTTEVEPVFDVISGLGNKCPHCGHIFRNGYEALASLKISGMKATKEFYAKSSFAEGKKYRHKTLDKLNQVLKELGA